VLLVKDSVYPKDLKLKKPDFKISVSGNTISITSNADARYIYLSSVKKDLSLTDNYFDLKTGETKVIISKNKIDPDIIIKSLYDLINAQ
jgi:hypothetical protein